MEKIKAVKGQQSKKKQKEKMQKASDGQLTAFRKVGGASGDARVEGLPVNESE